MSDAQAKVGIVMGSDSDADVMLEAARALDEFGVPCEVHVLSAHRTPHDVVEYVNAAREREIGVFICAAGGAAHLAGTVAAHTLLPVIGIPMDNPPLGGLDALLATVQMPGGVPVATVGTGGGGPLNAALTAARILALGDADLLERLRTYRTEMAAQVHAKNERLQARL